jgi:uncharacterized glyoxalase superfamily protein PhnB
MAKKIDPINKKNYGAVSANIIVADIKAAISFYTKAFGFEKRSIMTGPNRKPIHAELALRGTTLLLSPENPQRSNAKTMGGSPISLYLLVEDVDKVFAKAVKLGATASGAVQDMFWGDRSGTVVDPDGVSWMIATHTSEPTPEEMAKGMKAMMAQMSSASGA